MEEEIAEFSGSSDGVLEAVLLKSERRLKADLVVIGVGVTPATGIAGLDIDNRGLLTVDTKMAVEGSSPRVMTKRTLRRSLSAFEALSSIIT